MPATVSLPSSALPTFSRSSVKETTSPISTSSFISALTFSKYYCNKLLSSFDLNIAKSVLITDLNNESLLKSLILEM